MFNAMTGFVRFFRHTPFEQRLFFAAMLWLGLSRLAILLLPFRWIAPYLGRNMALTTDELPVGCETLLINAVQWAIQTASCYAPWECRCLVQAIAGKILLRRRGIPSTIYMGVRRDENNCFSAHAWLRCGKFILTGKPGMEYYAIVATFADT
jgi:hypothetical protein